MRSPLFTAFLLVAVFSAGVAAQQPVEGGAFTVERTGTGRPVILIPGMVSSGEVWEQTVSRYADRYELHVLTLAGFAGVPPIEADGFLRTERDAIIRYIRERQLDRPILIGHSLGGFFALWIAATAPDAVGPVVAVDGVPFLVALGDTAATDATMAAQAEQAVALYATLTAAQMEAQGKAVAAAMVKDTARARLIASWSGASDPQTAGKAYAEMLTTDIRDEVAAIRTPVLLYMAGGEQDPAIVAGMRERYAAQLHGIEDAELVVAENARHFIMYDDPDFFFGTLDRLLAEHP